jgi:integrase/recombinase XerD
MARLRVREAAAVAELSAEMEDFLSWLTVERGRAKNTLEAYRRDLKRYTAHLAIDSLTATDASEETLLSFLEALRAEGQAPASLKRTMVTVRSFHRYMADEGMIPDLTSPSHAHPTRYQKR